MALLPYRHLLNDYADLACFPLPFMTLRLCAIMYVYRT